MHNTSGQSAEQVEDHEANRPHPVFDIVAEDPERPHIADDVQPAPVQEHAGQKRPIVADRKADPEGPFRVGKSCRHNSEQMEELIQRWLRHRQLEEKNDAVGENQKPGGDGRVSTGNGVADREHRSIQACHRCLPASPGHTSEMPFKANCTAIADNTNPISLMRIRIPVSPRTLSTRAPRASM